MLFRVFVYDWVVAFASSYCISLLPWFKPAAGLRVCVNVHAVFFHALSRVLSRYTDV